MTQPFLEVLDPTARGATEAAPLAPPVDSLRGRVLGIRADRTWRSFQHFAHVLQERLPKAWGVREVVLFDPGIRVGTTEEERRKVAGFVRMVDAAIVGLGT
jgi:hypothetical protein